MRIIFLILTFLVGSLSSYPEEKISPGNFFSNAEKEAVLEGVIITKCSLKLKGIVHTQNTGALMEIPASPYISADLKSYELLCIEKTFLPYKINETSKLNFYSVLAAPSMLKGTQYYSISTKEVLQLITDCYSVDPVGKKPIADPAYKAVAPKAVNYFKVTDNRFGDLLFRSELYNEGNNFILKNVCIQPMEKYFIRINNDEEYQLISFFIYDNKAKGFFYYSVNAMRIRSDYFLSIGILSPKSFGNRIRGNTVQLAKLLGLDWRDKIKAFE